MDIDNLKLSDAKDFNSDKYLVVEDLKEIIKKLIKCLEWYANVDIYGSMSYLEMREPNIVISYDAGEKARKILEQYNKEGKQ